MTNARRTFDLDTTGSAALSLRADEATVFPVLRRQSPALGTRDELIFLLHTAAEIEHMLLSQYLYAAYSTTDSALGQSCREVLAAIAREEMGHLLCIQNMLVAVGAPLNFDRQDYPFNNLYPFEFKLEPLSLSSLAKYVLAEMPLASEIPPALGFDLRAVEQDAGVTPGGAQINRVGALFTLATELISQLSDAEIRPEWLALQADPAQWQAAQHALVLGRVESMAEMKALLLAIGAQGEGPAAPPGGEPSHFLRFLALYQQVKAATPSDLARAVPIDPTVLNHRAAGYIHNPAARAWCDLANQRLRWLFVSLEHHLRATAPQARNTLRRWAFEEMRALRDISDQLVTMPQHDPPQRDAAGRLRVAALPFDLPYSMTLPVRDPDLWRHHRMIGEHELEILARLQPANDLVARLTTQVTQRLTLLSTL